MAIQGACYRWVAENATGVENLEVTCQECWLVWLVGLFGLVSWFLLDDGYYV